jgi:DNA modification methylase
MPIKVLQGDCRDLLKTLPDRSVHCVVTSPPYFGLRDYGVEAQIGLEASPAAYVAEMVRLFREVQRVLRDDGTMWVNLGDSYANDDKWGGTTGGKHVSGLHGLNPTRERRTTGITAKSLIGIPWRVAFALQDDGWTLRQEIIWNKPNPMPESVEDRCTKSHEHIFLFTKSSRYFFDNVAIHEQVTGGSHMRVPGPNSLENVDRVPRARKRSKAGIGVKANESFEAATSGALVETRNRRTVWTVASQPFTGEFCGSCQTFFEGADLARLRVIKADGVPTRRVCKCGDTEGWVAHFAVFPPDLIEPCIKAGTSERGCCANCGSPWERMTFKTKRNASNSALAGRTAEEIADSGKWSGDALEGNAGLKAGPIITTETIGWKPTCACAAPARPCTVLDPFGGAGTTGLVADRLGRSAVLLELNPNYAEMARQRVRGDARLFAEVS